jgi:chain length determinant protein EpsF
MFTSKFLNALWQRKLLFILSSGAVFIGIVGSLYFWPKTYSATAKVLIDSKAIETVSGMPAQSQITTNFLTTQVDVVQSSRVANRAVELLKLDSSEAAKKRYDELNTGSQTFTQFYADQFQKSISVKPNRDSNVIDISFKNGDPAFAAQVANAFARAYISTNLELKVQPAKEFADWFETRIQGIRSNLKQTQRQHSDLQRKTGITSADERLDVENSRLQELSTQLVVLQGQLSDSERRVKSANSNTSSNAGKDQSDRSSISEVMGNPVVQALKADLARAQTKQAEMSESLGKKHPQMVRIEGEIEQIKTKLDRELDVATISVDKQLDINRGREITLRQSLAEQKEKVLKIKRDRDDLAVLGRELESAQRAHDLVAHRLTQTTLESQASLPSVVLLDEAVAPSQPISPKTSLGLMLAFILAPIVGLVSVLVHEALDKRVRSLRDLEDTCAGVRVLCIVGNGRPSRTMSVLNSLVSILRTNRSTALAR